MNWIGGVCGAFAAHFMFELPVLQVSETVRTGAGQWFAEVVATFGLVMAIIGSVGAAVTVTQLLTRSGT